MATIIKTGVCSYGMSGKLFHAPFINAHTQFELTGIVERNNNESRERYPHSKLYRSVEELCADKAIELIIGRRYDGDVGGQKCIDRKAFYD